ncbi:MAG: hypothetical protein GY798_08165 [Hyphomicrobiales bacterium]|nr:hypothetical protein [Hyphomicrobiales bacterium]
MPFDTTVGVLITVFIVLAMLCVGLAVTGRDIRTALADTRKTGRALIANLIVAPLTAIVLVAVLPMPPAAGTVLILLGFAPGGINGIQFSTKVPGYLATAAGLLFVLSIIALVVVPALSVFLLDRVDGATIRYGAVAFRAGLFILVPLVVGGAIRLASPAFATILYKPAMLISLLTFIASVVLSMALRQESLAALGTWTLVGMMAFILITMAAGWALGGPEREHRQILAVVTNLRNVGLVYTVVVGCCDDPLLPTAVLAFMALMVLPNLILTVYNAIWRKKHPVQDE